MATILAFFDYVVSFFSIGSITELLKELFRRALVALGRLLENYAA